MKPLVATVAVLVALATGALVQAQTPEIDARRPAGRCGGGALAAASPRDTGRVSSFRAERDPSLGWGVYAD